MTDVTLEEHSPCGRLGDVVQRLSFDICVQGSSEAGEQASRGKIVLLKKKVEELEQQLAQRNNELENKVMLIQDGFILLLSELVDR